MFSGKFASSRWHLEEALALYDPVSHRSLVHQGGIHADVISQSALGIVLFCLGYPKQALVQSNAAAAEARRRVHPPSLAATLSLGIRLLSLVGDDAVLGEWVDQLVAVTTEQGFPFWGALGTIYRGSRRGLGGRYSWENPNDERMLQVGRDGVTAGTARGGDGIPGRPVAQLQLLWRGPPRRSARRKSQPL